MISTHNSQIDINRPTYQPSSELQINNQINETEYISNSDQIRDQSNSWSFHSNYMHQDYYGNYYENYHDEDSYQNNYHHTYSKHLSNNICLKREEKSYYEQNITNQRYDLDVPSSNHTTTPNKCEYNNTEQISSVNNNNCQICKSENSLDGSCLNDNNISSAQYINSEMDKHFDNGNFFVNKQTKGNSKQ